MNDFFVTNAKPQEQSLDNTNRYFMGQQPAEDVIFFCRKHWITILPKIIGLIALFVATPSLFLFLHSNHAFSSYTIFLFILIGGLYAHHRLFVHLFNHYLNIVILTNYRIIELEKTILLRDHKCVIDLVKIQDIEKQQTGLLKNILNYGELHIHLSASNKPVILTYMPRPDKYFRLINQTKQECILKRQRERGSLQKPTESPRIFDSAVYY